MEQQIGRNGCSNWPRYPTFAYSVIQAKYPYNMGSGATYRELTLARDTFGSRVGSRVRHIIHSSVGSRIRSRDRSRVGSRFSFKLDIEWI